MRLAFEMGEAIVGKNGKPPREERAHMVVFLSHTPILRLGFPAIQEVITAHYTPTRIKDKSRARPR